MGDWEFGNYFNVICNWIKVKQDSDIKDKYLKYVNIFFECRVGLYVRKLKRGWDESSKWCQAVGKAKRLYISK